MKDRTKYFFYHPNKHGFVCNYVIMSIIMKPLLWGCHVLSVYTHIVKTKLVTSLCLSISVTVDELIRTRCTMLVLLNWLSEVTDKVAIFVSSFNAHVQSRCSKVQRWQVQYVCTRDMQYSISDNRNTWSVNLIYL